MKDKKCRKELAGLTHDAGASREERAFRMLMNTLGLGDTYINNLFEDCRDGLTLVTLIDKIEPGTVKWKKVVVNSKNKFKKLDNCSSDIVDRNKKLLLAFTWPLKRYYMLSF